MIMRTSSKLNAAFAILLVTANLLNCIKTEKDLSNLDTTIPPSLLETSLTPSIGDAALKIEPLSRQNFSPQVYKYLTPELISHSDPLAYLLSTVTRKVYNRVIVEPLIHSKATFESIRNHVHLYLRSRKLPRPYIPYAKLLYSIASCLVGLNRASMEIREFHIKYPKESDYPSLPSGISNPEFRTLFDADIFSDPSIPSVLVQKLVKIPNDKIPDVVKNLKRLLKNHNYVEQPYYEYMHFLQKFFEETKDLESLRDEYLEFQALHLKEFQ